MCVCVCTCVCVQVCVCMCVSVQVGRCARWVGVQVCRCGAHGYECVLGDKQRDITIA